MNECEDHLRYIDRLSMVNTSPALLRILIFSLVLVLLAGPYAGLLFCLCRAALHPVVSGVLLLSVQVVVGLLGSRWFFEVGLRLKSSLVPHCPGPSSSLRVVECDANDIARLFERAHMSLAPRASRVPDDLTDLAWFGVVVVAVVTVAATVVSSYSVCVAVISSPFHVALFILLLAAGYKSGSLQNLDDALTHLEFVITRTMKALSEAVPEGEARVFVSWAMGRRRCCIYDMGVSVTSRGPESYVIRYHFGLSKGSGEIIEFLPVMGEGHVRRAISECLSSAREWVLLPSPLSQPLLQGPLKLSWSRPEGWLLNPSSVEEHAASLATLLLCLLRPLRGW